MLYVGRWLCEICEIIYYLLKLSVLCICAIFEKVVIIKTKRNLKKCLYVTKRR